MRSADSIVLVGQTRNHGRQPNERAEKSGGHNEGQGAEAISHVPNLGWGMPIESPDGKIASFHEFLVEACC
jgi:hypothetical protein